MSNVIDHPTSVEWHRQQLKEARRPRIDGTGEPPDNGPMEARVARLEASVGHIQQDVSEIKSDLRAMLDRGLSMFWKGFVVTWAGLFALAFLMAKGFNWL